MSHLRYPDSDPYFPGVVVPLQPGEDPWELARAFPRTMDVITEPVAPQGDTGRGEVHNRGGCGTMGGENETGPNRTLATSNPGPDRDSTPTSGRGNRG